MPVLGDLVVLAPVVGLVLQVKATELVRALDEVMAQVDIAHLGHPGVLGDEAAAGPLLPSKAGVLGQVLVLGEKGRHPQARPGYRR